jgi:heptosyltransferase II
LFEWFKLKTLVIRLSSLGDVVLATTVLETFSSHDKVDWVVANNYSSLLENHPKIGILWIFNRHHGLWAWITLCRSFWNEHYESIYDLHCNLRTYLMRILFFCWSVFFQEKGPKWKYLKKERIKFFGFYIFKKLWPKCWRPTSKIYQFSAVGFGTGTERPNLRFLNNPVKDSRIENTKALIPFDIYLCVMPSSKWSGKCWPTLKYLEVLKKLSITSVILGNKKDFASCELVEMLKKTNINFYSGIDRWNLKEIAQVLAGSVGYFGNDTGLAHLAESVGVPAFIVYGPTVPEMGFAPWRTDSLSLQRSLWCRPCGKDGRYCIRLDNPYQCFKQLMPETVLLNLEKNLIRRGEKHKEFSVVGTDIL